MGLALEIYPSVIPAEAGIQTSITLADVLKDHIYCG